MRKVDDGLWDLNEDIDIVLDSERERWYLLLYLRDKEAHTKVSQQDFNSAKAAKDAYEEDTIVWE